MLNEDQRGFNWKTMGNGRAGADVAKAFANGLTGDLDQSGGISNKEWQDYQNLQAGMQKFGKDKMLNLFRGGKPAGSRMPGASVNAGASSGCNCGGGTYTFHITETKNAEATAREVAKVLQRQSRMGGTPLAGVK